jgi:hypothetical protein
MHLLYTVKRRGLEILQFCPEQRVPRPQYQEVEMTTKPPDVMVPGTTILFRRLVALILKIIDILLHV